MENASGLVYKGAGRGAGTILKTDTNPAYMKYYSALLSQTMKDREAEDSAMKKDLEKLSKLDIQGNMFKEDIMTLSNKQNEHIQSLKDFSNNYSKLSDNERLEEKIKLAQEQTNIQAMAKAMRDYKTNYDNMGGIIIKNKDDYDIDEFINKRDEELKKSVFDRETSPFNLIFLKTKYNEKLINDMFKPINYIDTDNLGRKKLNEKKLKGAILEQKNNSRDYQTQTDNWFAQQVEKAKKEGISEIPNPQEVDKDGFNAHDRFIFNRIKNSVPESNKMTIGQGGSRTTKEITKRIPVNRNIDKTVINGTTYNTIGSWDLTDKNIIGTILLQGKDRQVKIDRINEIKDHIHPLVSNKIERFALIQYEDDNEKIRYGQIPYKKIANLIKSNKVILEDIDKNKHIIDKQGIIIKEKLKELRNKEQTKEETKKPDTANKQQTKQKRVYKQFDGTKTEKQETKIQPKKEQPKKEQPKKEIKKAETKQPTQPIQTTKPKQRKKYNFGKGIPELKNK